MEIKFNENTELDGIVEIELTPEDYQDTFNKELKKYAKKADIKGFRKGMVPAGMIKKMYGRGILTEHLVETASKKLQEFVEEKGWNMIAKPLLEEHNLNDADVNQPSNHFLKFNLGFYKDFEIPMLNGEATYPLYNIKVEDADVDKEIERIKNDQGTRSELKEIDAYQDNDIIEFDAVEITDSGEIVEGGLLESNVRLLFEFFKDEETIKKISKSKPGDTLEINFPKAIDKSKEELVKNLFNTEKKAEEISDFFKISIIKVERLTPAELNEELYSKLFPENDVKNEEDLRKKLRTEISNAYRNQTKSIRRNFLQMDLIKNTDIPLPEAFLKKHIQISITEKKNDEGQQVKPDEIEVTDENLKQEIQAVKWELIRSKIIRDNDLQVNRDDVKAVIKSSMLQSMNLPPNYADAPFMDDFAEKTLNDKKQSEQYFMEAVNKKVMKFAEEKVKEDEKKVTLAEFQEIIKKTNDEY